MWLAGHLAERRTQDKEQEGRAGELAQCTIIPLPTPHPWLQIPPTVSRGLIPMNGGITHCMPAPAGPPRKKKGVGNAAPCFLAVWDRSADGCG